MSITQRHTRLWVVTLLLTAAPALSNAEVLNFDTDPTGPIRTLTINLRLLNLPMTGSEMPRLRKLTCGIGLSVHRNALLLSNQGTSIQTYNTNGSYPNTFTFRGAYFTAATNESLVVTVSGTRWDRDLRTKEFVLSIASPTYVSFNWAGIDEIQISGTGGTPVKDRNSAMIIMDDVNIDMDGPFAFNPVKPCRLVDTRNPAGLFGGPQLDGNTVRDFLIPNNTDCGIPRNAAAYAINVTVVPGGRLGFLTIWPPANTDLTFRL